MRFLLHHIFPDFKVAAGLIIALTALLYVPLINNINLWTDEIYSVLMAKDSLPEMFHLLFTEDSKPPLYYLYLKAVLVLFPESYEIFGAHFASFILLPAAQLFAATAFRRDYGDKAALWLMTLIMLMPHSLWLAFEVRAYMLSALLLLMAAVYGLRLTDAPKRGNYAKFGLATAAALYTHYYCALLLMFLYGFILLDLWRHKKTSEIKKLLATAAVCALCFVPWLSVPLKTGGIISQYWYVNMSFVLMSPSFFISPLYEEILQSRLFLLTVFAATALSFSVWCGMFSPQIVGNAQNEANPKAKRQAKFFYAVSFAVIGSYLLLLALSFRVRPMLTARYMMAFALLWYAAGALVLCRIRFLNCGFLIAAVLGFIPSYLDIKASSFDPGTQKLVSDIRQFVPKELPIIAFDNNNLFCEYYLPEHTCLAAVGPHGEILRLPSVMKNINLYHQQPDAVHFALDSYNALGKQADCLSYQSWYRRGDPTRLCKISSVQTGKILEDSLNLRLHKYESR